MIHAPHGVWTATRKRFSHSTNEAGLSPDIRSIDIPLAEDTYFDDFSPTANFGGNAVIGVGERTSASRINRSWIKPDFSSIPSGAGFLTATLTMTPSTDFSNNARTMRAHRCLRDVVVAEATWNIWKSGNSWTAGGASASGNDYEATEIGSGSIPASPSIGAPLLCVTFVASELQKMFDGTYVNNGIVLFVDTQNDDGILYESSENSNPPVISITYI